MRTSFNTLAKESWNIAKNNLPKAPSQHILASYDDEHIIVYQAYKESIAKYAVEHQQFSGCPDFSLSRMTWIKPNFLWMMYRSDWARSKNQERVIAIWIKREVFEQQILANAVISNFSQEKSITGPFSTKEEWQKALANSDIRLQWDPYHGPSGNKQENATRCIQLGLRNEFNRQLATNVNNETQDGHKGWIVRLEDH